MKSKFQALIEVQQKEVNALFKHVSHTLKCGSIPSASLRLHYVQHDFTGEPAFTRLAETLVAYITQYCYSAKRRVGLSELERNKTFIKARKLFRDDAKAGQVGELLSYLFIEAVLQAPQVLKKMVISTNTDEERKGSDGVHMRWDDVDDVLEVIFAESKLWNSFSGALADAFESMNKFHSGRIKAHEVDCVSSYFPELDAELRILVDQYMSGELLAKSREVHACLIGFDWKEYQMLNGRSTSKLRSGI